MQISQAKAFSEERVVAVVNGTAVTSSDVNVFSKILSLQTGKKISGNRALMEAIETHLKIQEAENRKVIPTDETINKHIEKLAASRKQTTDVYLGQLRKKGINIAMFKKFLGAQLGWSLIIHRDYGKRVEIDDAVVKRNYEKIKNNPKPGLRLAQIRQIILPFEKGANREIIRARIAEAKVILTNFKGCRSIRSITRDIYNVKLMPIKEIPIDRLPAKARNVLRKTGPGKMLPPSINPKSGRIELTAYCANRTLKAPVPSFKQYKNNVFLGEIGQYSKRHMKKVKDLAIIEIKGK